MAFAVKCAFCHPDLRLVQRVCVAPDATEVTSEAESYRRPAKPAKSRKKASGNL